MCAEDRDCSGGRTCDGCGCVAPPACDYDSDCEDKGQVCRNGGCACACKADADCAEGQACDGCGCVPSGTPVAGIVRGHVNIESSLQLPLYRGVTEIYGDLSINGSAISDLGDTFDELRSVDGRIVFNGNEALEAIRFPKLRSAPVLTVSNATNVKTVEFPLLQESSISLSNLASLEGLDLSAWKKGSFWGYGLGHLKELSLRATKISDFQADESLELEKVELPELTTVLGSFSIASGSPGKLTTLSAPKLAVLGNEDSALYLTISGTLLTSLSGWGAKDWQVQAAGLRLTDNVALGTCAVTAFTTRFVPASEPPYTPNIARNLDNCTGACNLVAETCTGG
jgi:hypothetical protein